MNKQLQFTPDMNFDLEKLPEENRKSLLWWISKYFLEYATGAPATLKYKAQDLKHFLIWFGNFFDHDNIISFSQAAANQYITYLSKETVTQKTPGKEIGAKRWANRSINRKVDHLKGFSNWLFAQVPTPIKHNPMKSIKRLDVPVLNAKRIPKNIMVDLKRAAQELDGTEKRRDESRFKNGRFPLKKTARPKRDFAILELLKGSGLRVGAICNLDLDQLGFRRLERVKEKGLQERNVVISKEAYDRIKTYIEFERNQDVEIWGEAPALFLSIPQTKQRNPDATGRMNSRSIRRIIDKIATKALGEVRKKEIYPHLFRHDVGHRMYEKGGLAATQGQLGHVNTKYSLVYAQKTDEELGDYLDDE